MTKILVTGGAGFIGAHLVKRLTELNNDVIVLDNLSFGNRESIPHKDNIRFVEGSLTEKNLLSTLIDEFRPETVIHLAAIHFIPFCNDHPVETVETNIMGTKYLLEASKRANPDIFLFASSAAIYGISDQRVNEEDLVEPTDIYGMSKLTGEDLCRLFHNESGVRTIIARLFNVYGPGETNPHVIPEIVEQLNEGKAEVELGNVEPKRDFIHVRDVVDALTALIEEHDGNFDIFNVGSGVEYSVRELVEHFGCIIGEDIRIKSDESRKRKSDRMHLLSDISKIKKEIGWQPQVDIREGLRELIDN